MVVDLLVRISKHINTYCTAYLAYTNIYQTAQIHSYNYNIAK